MITPITYTNRKSKTYTLCQGRTQKGVVRYFFSPDPEGQTVIDHIPTGYEIRENVNGQVTLSKKRPQLIRPQERRAVEQAISRHPKAKNYRVDVKDKHIIVFENISPSLDTILGILENFVPLSESRREALEAKEAQFSQFSPVIRFELADPETRGYHIERMGYTGHGGWRSLTHWGDIETLADEIIPLLGTDGFFELW